MKCLDTPLLEDLLWGRPRARKWLQAVGEGGELATTEANLYELSLIARRSRPMDGALPRLRALEELRRALTVLPIDAEASRRATRLLERGPPPTSGELSPLVVGACLAHGVTELYTDRRRRVGRNPPGLKIVRVGQPGPKPPTNEGRSADP